jgi:3-deoxy-manno-octulosonate cytidylyltransferase (CMP-KDO synthetase)
MDHSLTPQTVIVVPARLASARFPGKLLAEVSGKPLVLWTAMRIARETPEFPLWFAVDSEEIGDVLSNAGFSTILTNPDLPSGTDRIAAANETIGAERLINVQADEPLVTRSQILALTEAIEKSEADMSTLATPILNSEDFQDSNVVKVVRDANGFAMYFSRASIPYPRDDVEEVEKKTLPLLRHLGIYGYTAEFLRAFTALPQGYLEQVEKLEQLRALEHGRRIAVVLTEDLSIGVDTPEDLVRVAPLLLAAEAEAG